jgi:hypothetical protein
MFRQQCNRAGLYLPLAMSLMAALLVLTAWALGSATPERDEGAGAHIFQLLIAGQAPIVLLFLATSDWSHRPAVLRGLFLQVAAIGLAMAALALTGL